MEEAWLVQGGPRKAGDGEDECVGRENGGHGEHADQESRVSLLRRGRYRTQVVWRVLHPNP